MFKRALKLGYTHEPLVLDVDPERTDAHLLMIHIVFFNLKTWLLGTHHLGRITEVVSSIYRLTSTNLFFASTGASTL